MQDRPVCNVFLKRFLVRLTANLVRLCLNEKFIQELLRSALVLLFWFFTHVNFYELSNMFLSAQRSLNAIISLLFSFTVDCLPPTPKPKSSLCFFRTKNVKSHFFFGFIVFVGMLVSSHADRSHWTENLSSSFKEDFPGLSFPFSGSKITFWDQRLHKTFLK